MEAVAQRLAQLFPAGMVAIPYLMGLPQPAAVVVVLATILLAALLVAQAVAVAALEVLAHQAKGMLAAHLRTVSVHMAAAVVAVLVLLAEAQVLVSPV